MTYALEISGLKKTYRGGFQALKGLDLKVQAGDFYALLGPNGAGKSTTIGVIASLVNKTEGKVKVFGYDIETQLTEAKKQIAATKQRAKLNTLHKALGRGTELAAAGDNAEALMCLEAAKADAEGSGRT